MPELPEVETIRMQLEKVIVGLRIGDIEVLRESSFANLPAGKAGASEDLDPIGKRVLGVRRRAKVQFIELENGVSLAIHLKMTGQLIFRSTTSITSTKSITSKGKTKPLRRPLAVRPDAKSGPQGRRLGETEGDALVRANVYDTGELPNKYTRVVISFSNGSRLYFNDLRVFGWIKVLRNSNIEYRSTNEIQNNKSKIQNTDEEFDKYGPEAIDEETFTLEYFRKMLGKTNRAVKLVILDQERLAGVGNIYANEALFRAGIRPDKKASILGYKDTKILREEIIKILREAIKHGGTSDKDEAFRQIDGSKGGYQKFLQVYNREGEPCLRCGQPVLKMKIGGRGSYYCPVCQR